MRQAIALGLYAFALAACGPSSASGDDDPTGDGGNGNGDGSGSDIDGDGNTIGVCTGAAKQIFTLEANKRLSRFDPSLRDDSNMNYGFTQVGYLNCPGSSAFFNPFSMSVDRNATAYVLYSHQNDPQVQPALYTVDTMQSGQLSCNTTTWATQSGIKLFSMGHSTDMSGGVEDSMYISGGTSITGGSATLATLNTTSYQATTIGNINGWAELSGNSKGELWAFLPLGTTPELRRINKTTGATEQTLTISGLPSGSPETWAFAWWGGDFWIFYKRGADPATIIYQVSATTGAVLSSVNTNSVGTLRNIVGAGVSTCAPIILL